MRPLIYLAAPYTHPDPTVVQSRVNSTALCAALLTKHGYIVYAPTVHCHALAQIAKLDGSFEFWSHHCLEMLKRSDRLYILGLVGWKLSTGIKFETEFWHVWKNSDPIIYDLETE